MIVNKTNVAYEVVIYVGSFLLTYFAAMVAAHGPLTLVVDYGCLVTALAATGLFHVGSQRTPAPLMSPKP